MVHLPRRYFFQARNEVHYKKRGNTVGGPVYMTEEFIRGQYATRDSVQESIDALNAAIDRLDQIINKMTEEGK